MNRLQASFLAVLLTLGLGAQAQQGNNQQGGPKAPTGTPGSSAQVLPDFADLVEKYGPAVVNITTQTRNPRQAIPGNHPTPPSAPFGNAGNQKTGASLTNRLPAIV